MVQLGQQWTKRICIRIGKGPVLSSLSQLKSLEEYDNSLSQCMQFAQSFKSPDLDIGLIIRPLPLSGHLPLSYRVLDALCPTAMGLVGLDMIQA